MSVDNSGCGTIVFILHCIPLTIGLIMIATGNGHDSKKDRQNKSYQKYEAPRQNYQSKPTTPSNVYTPPSYNYTPRIQNSHSSSNYEELWDECEELSSKLSDHDIDHEEPEYPMDYHDLEDLRDELQSLVDDNEID